MHALVSTNVHLTNAETGELLVTATRVSDTHTMVCIGGEQLVYHGTPDQFHRLAAGISNAVAAANHETGDET